MDERTRAAVEMSRRRALRTVRRAIDVVRLVISQNARLAELPEHRASAERRIAEGRVELERMTREEAAIVREIERSS
jgi:hypothetical protein